MTKLTLATATAALLLFGVSAQAQDAATTTAPKSAITCPEAGTVPDSSLPAGCKSDALSTQSTTQVPAQAPAVDENAAATAPVTTPPADAVAVVPAPDGILASQFMGQTVYSAANENVGEINDVVMTKSLDNTVAIVGVGGFLGIGEKDVAIPIKDITVQTDANNAIHLTIAATKEQLEAMPKFDRTAMK